MVCFEFFISTLKQLLHLHVEVEADMKDSSFILNVFHVASIPFCQAKQH